MEEIESSHILLWSQIISVFFYVPKSNINLIRLWNPNILQKKREKFLSKKHFAGKNGKAWGQPEELMTFEFSQTSSQDNNVGLLQQPCERFSWSFMFTRKLHSLENYSTNVTVSWHLWFWMKCVYNWHEDCHDMWYRHHVDTILHLGRIAATLAINCISLCERSFWGFPVFFPPFWFERVVA